MAGILRKPRLKNLVVQKSNEIGRLQHNGPQVQLIKFLTFRTEANPKQTILAEISDSFHFMRVAFGEECTDLFERHPMNSSQGHSRNLTSLKGGIIKVAAYKLGLHRDPSDGTLACHLEIEKFSYIGCDGNPTEGEPTYVCFEPEVKEWLAKLTTRIQRGKSVHEMTQTNDADDGQPNEIEAMANLFTQATQTLLTQPPTDVAAVKDEPSNGDLASASVATLAAWSGLRQLTINECSIPQDQKEKLQQLTKWAAPVHNPDGLPAITEASEPNATSSQLRMAIMNAGEEDHDPSSPSTTQMSQATSESPRQNIAFVTQPIFTHQDSLARLHAIYASQSSLELQGGSDIESNTEEGLSGLIQLSREEGSDDGEESEMDPDRSVLGQLPADNVDAENKDIQQAASANRSEDASQHALEQAIITQPLKDTNGIPEPPQTQFWNQLTQAHSQPRPGDLIAITQVELENGDGPILQSHTPIPREYHQIAMGISTSRSGVSSRAATSTPQCKSPPSEHPSATSTYINAAPTDDNTRPKSSQSHITRNRDLYQLGFSYSQPLVQALSTRSIMGHRKSSSSSNGSSSNSKDSLFSASKGMIGTRHKFTPHPKLVIKTGVYCEVPGLNSTPPINPVIPAADVPEDDAAEVDEDLGSPDALEGHEGDLEAQPMSRGSTIVDLPSGSSMVDSDDSADDETLKPPRPRLILKTGVLGDYSGTATPAQLEQENDEEGEQVPINIMEHYKSLSPPANAFFGDAGSEFGGQHPLPRFVIKTGVFASNGEGLEEIGDSVTQIVEVDNSEFPPLISNVDVLSDDDQGSQANLHDVRAPAYSTSAGGKRSAVPKLSWSSFYDSATETKQTIAGPDGESHSSRRLQPDANMEVPRTVGLTVPEPQVLIHDDLYQATPGFEARPLAETLVTVIPSTYGGEKSDSGTYDEPCSPISSPKRKFTAGAAAFKEEIVGSSQPNENLPIPDIPNKKRKLVNVGPWPEEALGEGSTYDPEVVALPLEPYADTRWRAAPIVKNQAGFRNVVRVIGTAIAKQQDHNT
ncbi:hypothetical protein BZG36_01464 [Bifiguratus adelaidae]|uniref:Telomere replication protein EST3 n=1 Tax=Bifiguratus adelaidae TaxID=1938954 RepID=A0A261Y4Y1_9FUNG|nr:hypothetical protein BZG36_01464 [Bifiguratus adelaidae]